MHNYTGTFSDRLEDPFPSDTPLELRPNAKLMLDASSPTGPVSVTLTPTAMPGTASDTISTYPHQMTLETINSAAALCWLEWEDVVFRRPLTGSDYLPLNTKEWDFADHKYDIQSNKTELDLASAGHELFNQLFIYPQREASPFRRSQLQRMVKSFRTDWATRDLVVLAEHISGLTLPLGLIYTQPDGEPPTLKSYRREHFWGFRHVIEQRPFEYKPAGQSRLKSSEGSGLRTAVGHEPRPLAGELGRHIDFWKALDNKGSVVLQHLDGPDALMGALVDQVFDHQLLYIICRGTGTTDGSGGLNTAQPELRLDPFRPLTPSRLRSKLKEGWTCPVLLFLNTCQAGQASNVFHYDTFANLFLQGGAVGVLGPVTRIPEQFAIEYAQQFFKLLLGLGPDREESPRHVGQIVRHLAKHFLEKHNNPLGLTYALRCGAGCRIDPVTESAKPNSTSQRAAEQLPRSRLNG